MAGREAEEAAEFQRLEMEANIAAREAEFAALEAERNAAANERQAAQEAKKDLAALS